MVYFDLSIDLIVFSCFSMHKLFLFLLLLLLFLHISDFISDRRSHPLLPSVPFILICVAFLSVLFLPHILVIGIDLLLLANFSNYYFSDGIIYHILGMIPRSLTYPFHSIYINILCTLFYHSIPCLKSTSSFSKCLL